MTIGGIQAFGLSATSPSCSAGAGNGLSRLCPDAAVYRPAERAFSLIDAVPIFEKPEAVDPHASGVTSCLKTFLQYEENKLVLR
ncbi:MAG: hypothetical protein H6667_05245 [Ardenticatenaceae bacterium]|nr:hypothetical protein [Ardenticatenaceae bacterium]